MYINKYDTRKGSSVAGRMAMIDSVRQGFPSRLALHRSQPELRDDTNVIRREVSIREAHDFGQIRLIDLPQNGIDGDRLGRIPDIVEHAVKARHVICDQAVADSHIRTLQAQLMMQPLCRIVPIYVIHKVWVIARDAPVIEELVNATARNGVEVSAKNYRNLARFRVGGRGWLAFLWWARREPHESLGDVL